MQHVLVVCMRAKSQVMGIETVHVVTKMHSDILVCPISGSRLATVVPFPKIVVMDHCAYQRMCCYPCVPQCLSFSSAG